MRSSPGGIGVLRAEPDDFARPLIETRDIAQIVDSILVAVGQIGVVAATRIAALAAGMTEAWIKVSAEAGVILRAP